MPYICHLILLLFCLGCTTSPAPPKAPEQELPTYPTASSKLGLIHQMQGRWTDSRIKDAELLITGNKFVSIYKEEVRNQATFEVFEKCPPVCQGKEVPQAMAYFVVHRADGNYCYALDNLANGVLEYTPL